MAKQSKKTSTAESRSSVSRSTRTRPSLTNKPTTVSKESRSASAMVSRQNYFDFMGLPAELREDIYELAFANPVICDHDILTKRRAPAAALHLVSKQVYSESAKAHGKAQAQAQPAFQEARKTVVQSLKPYPAHMDFMAEAWSRLTQDMSPCQHECHQQDCYACDSPDHQACFGCGMWHALAAYYEIHPDNIPKLFSLRDGQVEHTALGSKIQRTGEEVRYDWRESELHGPHLSKHWWAAELDRQLHIALRCKIRWRAMVRSREQGLGKKDSRFDDATLSKLEEKDANSLTMSRWEAYTERSLSHSETEWLSTFVYFVEKATEALTGAATAGEAKRYTLKHE
ncbi:hypothetical protein LTR86_000271 [Recurvomyces mirabilis]|nr:hypothetical protein LTR86_000271 [Recurvomyces mirabilis]